MYLSAENSQKDDFKIERQRPVLHIPDVMTCSLALLLFCFMLAVNLSEGIDVVGDGLEKLRAIIRRVS